MNTRFLAFLGATAFFVPASVVPAPSAAASTTVQSGRSLSGGGASQAALTEFRSGFGQVIDGIRSKLEERLLALDLSDPGMVGEFLDRQELLEAWDALATALPQLPDDQLAATRTALSTALKGLSRIGDLQQRVASKRSTTGVGAGACAVRAYQDGSFGGGQVFVDSWEALIGNLMVIYRPQELIPILARLPATIANIPYTDGPQGEREAKEAQALLEFYSAQMPKTGVADPLTPTGAPLRVIEVPHPLKLMFDIMVHANRREVIKAEFMNDDFESCEREALATMISDLAGDFQLLETGVQQVMTDLQGFRDETKDALVTLDADVVNLRREAAVAFRNLAGQVDRRTSNLDAALNARANELKLKLDTAEGMLLLILDEVD